MVIQDIIDSAVIKEDRKVTSWQASKIGGCLSGVYLERLGVPRLEQIDARLRRVFQCGNLFEEYVVTQIEKANIAKVETQLRVEDAVLDVTGYADIKLEYLDGSIEIAEVKSQNSRAFWYMIGDPKKGRAPQGAYEHHKMQVLIYMHILGIERGRLVYVSKDDLCIQEYEVTIQDEVLQKALANIATLNNAWKTGVMPAPAEPGTFQAKYCGWHDYCTGKLPLPTL